MKDKIVVIVPTIGRPDYLEQTVKSFLDTSEHSIICVIADGEPLPGYLSYLWADNRVISLSSEIRRGFWATLNFGLGLTERPIIGFFGNDVIFYPDWEELILGTFTGLYADGKALVAVKDDVWDSYHASHGFIGRQFLYALYGEEKFPDVYYHKYADSELTQFAKDLDRFIYCEGAYIKHLHPTKGAREIDWVDTIPKQGTGAKRLYDSRYKEWDTNGRKEARKRL